MMLFQNPQKFYLVHCLILTSYCICDTVNGINSEKCNLSQTVKDEIASYAPIAEQIINATVYGTYKGTTYRHLEEFIHKFGNRLIGTRNLENAIDYMLNNSVQHNLENVHGEESKVAHWIRGKESATLLEPWHQPLSMLGLGSSVGTPPEGIQAEAMVVSSFEELEDASMQVRGKIVVFNQQYTNYSLTVKFRRMGASVASRYGAVATLIRSLTPFPLNVPHTGWQSYQENVTKIPTACITVEDANMLHQMYKQGKTLIIEIKMQAQNLPPATSRNTIADIFGNTQAAKTVIITAHLDSWDVGQGAMDNGGGAFMTWNSLVILKGLGLRAKRTIRAMLCTAEEQFYTGAHAYMKAHENETNNLNFIMESDRGTFTPKGLKYTGVKNGGCILQEILNLLESINATQLKEPVDDSSDIGELLSQGIPGATLYNQAEKYYWFHHSPIDTMDIEDSDTLDKCTSLWATVAYIIADLSFDMPRKD